MRVTNGLVAFGMLTGVVNGRSVAIELSNDQEFLQICEVELYIQEQQNSDLVKMGLFNAEAFSDASDIGADWSGGPMVAIDNVTSNDGDSFPRLCYHSATRGSTREWWRAYLLNWNAPNFNPYYWEIRFYHRTGCTDCNRRNVNIEIRVDQVFQGITMDPREENFFRFSKTQDQFNVIVQQPNRDALEFCEISISPVQQQNPLEWVDPTANFFSTDYPPSQAVDSSVETCFRAQSGDYSFWQAKVVLPGAGDTFYPRSRLRITREFTREWFNDAKVYVQGIGLVLDEGRSEVAEDEVIFDGIESESPTISPTPLPTTGSPTSAAPTSGAPTTSPTTSAPTLSPTNSPTPSPTPFPTTSAPTSPTTSAPTSSPIVPLDFCQVGEWEASSFDPSMANCGNGECALEQALEQGRDVRSCMSNCMERIMDISESCAFCFGRYADCMLTTCECFSGRGESNACESCSANNCEPLFNTCSGGVFVEPYIQPITEPLDQSLIYIIAGSGGGFVFLAGVALFYLSRRRSRKARQVATTALTAKTKDHSDSMESDNPAYGGAPPVPPSSSKPAASLTAEAKARFSLDGATKPSGEVRIVKFPVFGLEDDELTCVKGEKVEILERVDENWLLGRSLRSGEEGIIPENVFAT